jgi:hemoglobin-like flavoprotein
LTPRQKDLVQSSFAKVVPIADEAAVFFYDDLFRRDPELRALFKGDMAEQGRMLMKMLGTIVGQLKDWKTAAPAVKSLGHRHVTYGVKMIDYDTVGAALIATLEKGLGDAFTPEVREAWVACYSVVSGQMLDAAKDAAAV